MNSAPGKVDEIIKRYNIRVDCKSGNEYRCYCPIHNEANPSFSINALTGKWICFANCGSGGLVKLIMKLSHCDYNTAVEEIYGKQNKYSPDIKHVGEKVITKSSVIDLPDEFERIVAVGDCPKYLINRLSLETIKHFGLGKCEEGYFQDRIIIPVKNKESGVGFIARDYSGNAEKKYLFPKGFKTKDYLFNIDSVVSDEAILVEGPFDAMAMYEKGFKNTACVFGVSVSIRQATMLHDKGVKNVVICLDNDEGKKQNVGLIAAGELSKRFRYFFNNVYIMQLPPQRDPDECSRKELLAAYLYKKVVATKVKYRETYDNIGNTI